MSTSMPDRPAFPVSQQHFPTLPQSDVGLTKRELIATACLQGLVANHCFTEAIASLDIAERYRLSAETAVLHADALLAALEAKP